MMNEWRARMRRRLFKWRLPAVVGENPLELGMITWAIFAAGNALTGTAPSRSLSALPDGLEYLWAVLMTVAGVCVLAGMSGRRETLQASGMYLFACTMATYSVAIFGVSGWTRGALVGVFFVILAIVSFLRGWWLKDEEALLIRAMVRKRLRGE
jgi:hypothetical protein